MNKALAETIAAVSGDFHTDRRYKSTYSTYADQVGGFPAFYELVVDAAKIFETAARKRRIRWGETADWILSVGEFVGNLYRFLELKWPNADDLKAIANKSFVE